MNVAEQKRHLVDPWMVISPGVPMNAFLRPLEHTIPFHLKASWILTLKRQSSEAASRPDIPPRTNRITTSHEVTGNSLVKWSSTLVRLIRRGDLSGARRVFDRMPRPHVYQYTMMIGGYCRAGKLDEALHLFDNMTERDTACWNSLIKGSLRCGELELAREIFEKMPERNVISWTTIVDGLAQSGRICEAEHLFSRMPERDVAAWNSMISGYFGSGRVADAMSLFEKMPCRNTISWTAMIAGLSQNGKSEEALLLFEQMPLSGIEATAPTSTTFASVLMACSKTADLGLGTQLHARLTKSGAFSDAFISTCLITLYASSQQTENSLKILHDVEYKTVVSWTALISGYGSTGKHQCALDVFKEMRRSGTVPNQSTFTSVLNSCGELEAVDEGKEIHGNAVKLGLGQDTFVGNSLIFMYFKSGETDDAVAVFNDLQERNLVSWNSVINGCAQNGLVSHSLRYFKAMALNYIPPDEVTFVGLLAACSHSKMAEKARYFYNLLRHDPSLQLKLEHCVCMVDALCRSEKLEEAEEFINNMPLEPNAAVWLSLLSACRAHLKVEIATRAAKSVFSLEPDCAAAYILLSNIYADAGLWDEVWRIRLLMKRKGILKQPGYSGLH